MVRDGVNQLPVLRERGEREVHHGVSLVLMRKKKKFPGTFCNCKPDTLSNEKQFKKKI